MIWDTLTFIHKTNDFILVQSQTLTYFFISPTKMFSNSEKFPLAGLLKNSPGKHYSGIFWHTVSNSASNIFSPLIVSSFALLCNMHFNINIRTTKILLSTSYWFIFTKSSTLKVFRHANCWLKEWGFWKLYRSWTFSVYMVLWK